MLKGETWDNILCQMDVNVSFNTLLSTFLICFETCFILQYVPTKGKNNHWINLGIRTSCQRKKILYIFSKTSNNSKIKAHYALYCNILRRTIRKAKEMHYNELLVSSTNKSRTAWNIINNQ
jgi:hypothetical protein